AIVSGNDVVDGSFVGETATGGAGGAGVGGGFFGANSPGGNGGNGTGGGISIATASLMITSAQFIRDAATGAARGPGGLGTRPAANGSDGTGIGGGLYIAGTSIVTIKKITLAGNVASTSDPDVHGSYSS